MQTGASRLAPPRAAAARQPARARACTARVRGPFPTLRSHPTLACTHACTHACMLSPHSPAPRVATSFLPTQGNNGPAPGEAHAADRPRARAGACKPRISWCHGHGRLTSEGGCGGDARRSQRQVLEHCRRQEAVYTRVCFCVVFRTDLLLNRLQAESAKTCCLRRVRGGAQ